MAPKKANEPYSDEEIALIFVFKRTKEGKARLAKLLNRSESAIDWVWRWRDDDSSFGERAHNKIRRQIRRVQRVLGSKARGVIRYA